MSEDFTTQLQQGAPTKIAPSLLLLLTPLSSAALYGTLVLLENVLLRIFASLKLSLLLCPLLSLHPRLSTLVIQRHRLPPTSPRRHQRTSLPPCPSLLHRLAATSAGSTTLRRQGAPMKITPRLLLLLMPLSSAVLYGTL